MAEEKYTDAVLRSFDDDQLMELIATFPAEDAESASTQRDLLVRISAELERRRRTASPAP